MNKTYIKRQLTLNKLDIPLSNDVQEYIDLVNELVGNPNELKKEKMYLYGKYEGYSYSRNDNKLLFHIEKDKCFYVHYDNIWKKFGIKFKLNYINNDEMNNLLTPLLEEVFNCSLIELIVDNLYYISFNKE